MAGLLRSLERWKSEAGAAGRTIDRVELTYEAGRDGLWNARDLQERGNGVHVMDPGRRPVTRRRRRDTTQRNGLQMPVRKHLGSMKDRTDVERDNGEPNE